MTTTPFRLSASITFNDLSIALIYVLTMYTLRHILAHLISVPKRYKHIKFIPFLLFPDPFFFPSSFGTPSTTNLRSAWSSTWFPRMYGAQRTQIARMGRVDYPLESEVC